MPSRGGEGNYGYVPSTWVNDRVRGGRSKLHREKNATALVKAVLFTAGRD